MPPDSDGRIYTVGCRLGRLIPDQAHVCLVEDAVQRVHKATFLAAELANIHLRRCLRENLPFGDLFFYRSWLGGSLAEWRLAECRVLKN